MNSKHRKLALSVLANDEHSTDGELLAYFLACGMDRTEAENAIKHRTELRDAAPVNFEQEALRSIPLWGDDPYKPRARYIIALLDVGYSPTDADVRADTPSGQKAITDLQQIDEAMEGSGFEISDTGGGCLAYILADEKAEILITRPDDPSTPVSLLSTCILSVHTESGELLALHFESVHKLLDAIRKAKP